MALLLARLRASKPKALIRDELKRGNSERAIRSALALGRFYRFAGVAGDHKIVKEALIASQQLAGDDGRGDDDKHELVAECYRVLGSMERLCCPDIEDAQNPYNKASEWYKKLSDETRMLLGLAHCQRARADIETVQADPRFREKARSHYEAALEQYEKVLHSLNDNNDKDRQRQQAKRGKAYCLAHLGDATHMNATHILRAREADGSDQIVTKAKEFYRMAQETFQAVDVNDAIGVAHCKKGLGDIYCIEPSSNEEPSTFYRDAAVLYHKSGYIVGVADCQYSMGDYAFRKPNCVKQARKRYEIARRLYDRIGSPHGVANCLYSLGDVSLYCSYEEEQHKRLDTCERLKRRAKKYYDEALTRYNAIGSKLGPANCHRGRGDILSGKPRLEEYERSETALMQAFDRKDVTPWFTFGEDWQRWRR